MSEKEPAKLLARSGETPGFYAIEAIHNVGHLFAPWLARESCAMDRLSLPDSALSAEQLMYVLAAWRND